MKTIRMRWVVAGAAGALLATVSWGLGGPPLVSKVVYWADFENDTVGNKPAAVNVKVGLGQTASWAVTEPSGGSIRVATDGSNKYMNWTAPTNWGKPRAYLYVDKGVNLADIGPGESLVQSFKFRWNLFTNGTPYSRMSYYEHGWSGGSLPSISSWYQRGDSPVDWMIVGGSGAGIEPGPNLTAGHWYVATQVFDFVAHNYTMSVTDLGTGQGGSPAPQSLVVSVTNAGGFELNQNDSGTMANLDIDDIKLQKFVPVKGAMVMIR